MAEGLYSAISQACSYHGCMLMSLAKPKTDNKKGVDMHMDRMDLVGAIIALTVLGFVWFELYYYL